MCNTLKHIEKETASLKPRFIKEQYIIEIAHSTFQQYHFANEYRRSQL